MVQLLTRTAGALHLKPTQARPTGTGQTANAAGSYSKWLLPVVLLSVFVMPISISGTSVALPYIARSLGSDPTRLQWVINGFNVAAAIFMIVWGVVSDRVGYRFTFMLGVFVMLAANCLSLASQSLLMLDAARIIAGIGAAGLFAGAAAILSNAYTGDARRRAFAFFGTTVGLGVALGPTIAGGLTSAFGWRGIFTTFAIVLGISATGFGVLPHLKHDRLPGAKAIDFSVLRNKRFLAYALVPVAQALGYVTLVTYLPVAFSAIKGLDAGSVGLVMLPATLPVLAGPVIAAQLIKHVRWMSPFTIITIALIALAIGDAGMLLLRPSLPLGWLIPPMILLGFGFGLPIGLVDGEALALVPARNSGTAAGVINFMRLGSEAVAVAVYAVVIAAIVRGSLHSSALAATTTAGQAGHGGVYASSLHTVVIVIAALTVALTIVIGALSRTKQDSTPEDISDPTPAKDVMVTVSCWEGSLQCRADEAKPMIKMDVFLTRRSDLTHGQFTDYWTNHHNALVTAMPASVRNTRKYIQQPGTGESIPGLASATYDGIAEIWVDDLAGARELFENAYYDTVIAPDEAEFMDRSKTVFMYSTEDVVFG